VIDPRLSDSSQFPNPVYRETVLRPLFDGAKRDHVDGFRAIDRAHLVMLCDCGILTRAEAGAIAKALENSATVKDRELYGAKLTWLNEMREQQRQRVLLRGAAGS
jgi:argininosuccinate lyase